MKTMRTLMVVLVAAGAFAVGTQYQSESVLAKPKGGLPKPPRGECFICRFSPDPTDASCATTKYKGYKFCVVDEGEWADSCNTILSCEGSDVPEDDLEELL